MPKFVGLQNPDYEDRKTDRIFEANCREGEITTEGIENGLMRTQALFQGEYQAMITQSAMYVREKK